jgi:hypothetical protein
VSPMSRWEDNISQMRPENVHWVEKHRKAGKGLSGGLQVP